eukprot:6462456-Amphidinium_carterae.1
MNEWVSEQEGVSHDGTLTTPGATCLHNSMILASASVHECSSSRCADLEAFRKSCSTSRSTMSTSCTE